MILALLAQATTPGVADYGFDAPMIAPQDAPTFADEFDGRRVDDARWGFDVERNATGWFNHEQQYYARANARIVNGALMIQARRQTPRRVRDWGGQGYTSAKLVSRAALGFGYYEVRAKLPCGRGTGRRSGCCRTADSGPSRARST